MSTMATVSKLKKDKKLQETDLKTKQADFGQVDNKNLDMIDEESEEDDDYQVPEANLEVKIHTTLTFVLFLQFEESFTADSFNTEVLCDSCTGGTYQI